MWGLCGNTNKLGDIGMYNWKSSLFFLTVFISLNGLTGAREMILAEQFTIELSVMFMTILENPSKIIPSRQVVPITASGLQG